MFYYNNYIIIYKVILGDIRNYIMNDEELYYELEKLHDEGKHKEIISMILSLSEEQLNDDIKGLLAVAYNNAKEFDLAIETLNSLSEDIKNHHNVNK